MTYIYIEEEKKKTTEKKKRKKKNKTKKTTTAVKQYSYMVCGAYRPQTRISVYIIF